MTRQPTPIRIPILEIFGKVELKSQRVEWPQGLKLVSELEIPVPRSLPEQCYALEIPDIFGDSVEPAKSLGIFGLETDTKAMDDVYALGLAGQEPLICKIVKKDAQPSSSRRKSFMTPTPLHIPESRVSPIPDSAHEMIYLMDLNKDKALRVVPVGEVVWMHPLISVMKNSPD